MEKEKLVHEHLKTQLQTLEEKMAVEMESLHKQMQKTHKSIMLMTILQVVICAIGYVCWLAFYPKTNILSDFTVAFGILTGVFKSWHDFVQEKKDHKMQMQQHEEFKKRRAEWLKDDDAAEEQPSELQKN